MLGAIIGDIVGSTREWNNVKATDFDLLPQGSTFTDDTVMTLAVAKWLMDDPLHSPDSLVKIMQELGRKYPNVGYGKRFKEWLMSDNPQPYGSWGNGSAMRVSPVGLYAKSLDEALELARISASVSHNHPEGIKGAQAIAACVYMKKNERWDEERTIKKYIEDNFDYNLNERLEDLRDNYSFDVSCQGSVPIAIMAYLQGRNLEDSLRLAISMGGDSDTIGCMAASIAFTERLDVVRLFPDTKPLEEKCKSLLTPELLEIHDRFEAFIGKPLYQSYELCYGLYAGEYPGDKNGEKAEDKLSQITHFGVKHFIDFTDDGEFPPYQHLLPKDCSYMRFPIQNYGIPQSIEFVDKIIKYIKDLLTQNDGYIYMHCIGGVGRTGTIAGCFLADETFDKTMEKLRECFSKMPKSKRCTTPENNAQESFIRSFVESKAERDRQQETRIKDCIRGSLMGGAAGAALGLSASRLSAEDLVNVYGNKGITKFVLSYDGKVWVNCDTQMMLYTANGMLMGITRGCIRGIGGIPEDYVGHALMDWYFTQTGETESDYYKYPCTWLRDLRDMAFSRSPGATCLRSCESLVNRKEPKNNSKGCGGIVRVAPMGLLDAARGNWYSKIRLAEAAAKIVKYTHLHPMAYLPAGLLAFFISRIVALKPEEVKSSVFGIVNEGIEVMMQMYGDGFASEKEAVKAITLKAVSLAKSDIPDLEAIVQLGDGWVAEETWAISLFCSLRHIDSIEDAIIAAVNHNGHKDSVALLTGNIMGAIYGYESIKKQNLFCPDDYVLEDTLELSRIILALADDLYSGCCITEYDCDDTPEKKQWFERYWEMKPVGI